MDDDEPEPAVTVSGLDCVHCSLSFYDVYLPIMNHRILIFCFLLLSCSLIAEELASDSFPSIEELLEAGLYSQALAGCNECLAELPEDVPSSQLMDARFRLAKVHFAMKNEQQALDLLDENLKCEGCKENDATYKNSIYLSALIYKNLLKYREAKELFSLYLDHSGDLSYRDEARFEFALMEFLLSAYDQARKDFLNIETKKPRLQALIKIYLARILLIENNGKEAAVILNELSLIPISKDDLLHFEICYLKGEAYFQTHEYMKAIHCFDQALPEKYKEKCSWWRDTLYHQGLSYLKLANRVPGEKPAPESISNNLYQAYFKLAEDVFLRLLADQPEEKVYLALGQCYLEDAKRFKNKNSYLNAEKILSDEHHFLTKEAQAHALLLRAEAAPSYFARDRLYQQLTEESPDDDDSDEKEYYTKGWFMRGHNDFNQAQFLVETGQMKEAAQIFSNAANAFNRASVLFEEENNPLIAEALKYQALAVSKSDGSEVALQAYKLMDTLITRYPFFWQSMEHPDEALYLRGFFAAVFSETTNNKEFINIAEASLFAAAADPKNKFGDIALCYLGGFHYRCGHYLEAEKAYGNLVEKYRSSPLCGEAWFWMACCADKQQLTKALGQEWRRNCFEQFPDSPYAAEAYFTLYSYQDYLQGDRKAIKHLNNFVLKYSDSPLLIEAYYLLGLDLKRDRKTPEGKWIRKKNLTEAISAFQKAESIYLQLIPTSISGVSQEKWNYYAAVYYRAVYERAMINLAIAEESQGAKQKIYFEYAEGVFQQLVNDFQTPNAYIESLFKVDPLPMLYQESIFYLAQTLMKTQQKEKAEQYFSENLLRYEQAHIANSYYLSRTHYSLGILAMQQQQYLMALESFKKAEETGKNLLSTDQKLDLWIQESLCYRGFLQYDQAILILSKVVNDDAVSALRLKAMFLRAETYELQGRPELARKQLESMAKKGGPWALKAKEKMEKEYGY